MLTIDCQKKLGIKKEGMEIWREKGRMDNLSI
jgi:hypothetical protein